MSINSIIAALVLFSCCSLTARAASPVRVTADPGIANPRQPQAAVDEQGAIYIAFGAGEAVYCAVSSDGGKNYKKPVKIGDVNQLALGMRRGPRIAAGHGTVVVSAISHEAGNLLSWRSIDGGKTWQKSVQVNDSPRDAREGLHAMAMGPSGELYCAWLDHRSGKTEIYGASSSDGGRSWSDNKRIYASPSGSVCECCHPSVTYDAAGSLYVMWRNSLDGARDMYMSVSGDGGKTFPAAKKLGIGTWNLNACPMDGGSIAITAAGEMTTIWRRDQQIYITRPGEIGEEKLGSGLQPWMTATPSGAWSIWVNRRGGDLWLLSPSMRQPIKLAGTAWEPIVAAPLAGTGPIVAVWESGSGTDTAIFSADVAAN